MTLNKTLIEMDKSLNRKLNSSTFYRRSFDRILVNLKFPIFLLVFFSAFNALGQNALEQIIVEKYYVVDQEDNNEKGITPGTTTYRIYLDLAPNHTFQAAYGSPEHPMHFSTSTQFYNQTNLGNIRPEIIPNKGLRQNYVPLDTWLSAGAAGESYLGVPLDEDKDENITLSSKHLKGFSLQKDGLYAKVNPPITTLYGLDSALISLNGSSFKELKTSNGAWACMGRGSKGADSLGTNKILIGQFTTDGDFDFSFNVQIGTPAGKSINYVASHPQGNEIQFEQLNYHITPQEKQKVKSKKQKK